MGQTFVLVHGGHVGGWQFKRVAQLLRAAGHEAYAPTLTGHGDRAHLGFEGVTMETWIEDVARVIEFEDLHDVILVAHSFGGMVIPAVAVRHRERIRRVVWMASLVLRDGEPMLRYVENAPRALAHDAAVAEGRAVTTATGYRPPAADAAQAHPSSQDWILARMTASPSWIRDLPATGLDAFLQTGIPTGYILALRDRSLPPEICREFASRLPGCRYIEVDASHNLMTSRPELTTQALLRMIDP